MNNEKIKQIFSKKRIVFLILFFVLVLVGKKINFSPVVGADNQFFTLFQFFGPLAGSFLNPIFGIVSVLLVQLADFLIVGKEFGLINLLRLLPMLFAVYYFGTKKKSWGVIIPLVCIFLFIIHPIGRQVWFFSLYWLIPVFGKILPEKIKGQLFFKSYGATFTAHAVGSTIWLYTVPMAAGQWISLIPIVAYERFLFGLGIAGSYIVFNTVLDYVLDRWKITIPTKVLFLDKRYNLMKLLHLKKN
jgi:hypothetical protein